MRMKYIVIVLALCVVLTMPSSSHSYLSSGATNESLSRYLEQYQTSSNIASGILDPVTIKQTGNSTTGTIHAETDDDTNIETNLQIDIANGWVGDLAVVHLYNPERLYIANGSFDDGVEGETINPLGSVANSPYGWDAYSYTPSAQQIMIAGYVNQEITVKSRSSKIAGSYPFYNNSWVYWTQTVINTPSTNLFYLSFDYNYLKGPISNHNVTLRVMANDTLVWNATAESLELDYLYHTGDIPLDLSEFSGMFNFKIGLYFCGDVIFDQNTVQFSIDNVKLHGQSAPSFDDLDIYLSIGGDSVPVTGGTIGFASITNSSLWQTSAVPIKLLSVYSVSFDYNASMRNSRYLSSSYTLDPTKTGVSYQAQSGASSELTFYMYLGAIPSLEDFTIVVYHPIDWDNATILNPFLTDVTFSCTLYEERIIVPESVLYTLGWWEFMIESPNYLNDLLSQVSDTGIDPWVDNSIFESSDYIRASVQISSGIFDPIISSPVNVTFVMPNGTEWRSDSLTGGSGQSLNTTGVVLGSSNTTAGLWMVCAAWTNGTEVAYGEAFFEVHHNSIIVPIDSSIETEAGQTFSAFVQLRDAETNEILLDPSAVIIGNWSASVVTFMPNEIHNRWEVNLDTTGFQPGVYIVQVNASLQYYTNSVCHISIAIQAVDNTLDIHDASAEMTIGEKFTTYVNYSDNLGNGIEGAEVTVSLIEPSGGITWANVVDLGDGNYSIELTATASGTYHVTVRASKAFYEYAENTMVLLISKISTELTDLSLDTLYITRNYSYIVEYRTLEGAVGIIAANIEAYGRGSDWVSWTDLGDGRYNITISPIDYGTYQVELDFTKEGYLTATAKLSFSVDEIPIIMEVSITPWHEVAGLTVNVTLFSDDTGEPVHGALVQCTLQIGGIDELTYTLDESVPGFYTKHVLPDWVRSESISLLIEVSQEFYSAVSESIQVFQRAYERSTLEFFVDFVMIPLFSSLGIFFSFLASARYYGRRRDRIRRELIEITMRFDDASNILGILILHKRSGLPIFSNILKGGFEEGMLSAFITAITHFRSEFEGTESDDVEHEWRIIPVSDIIRAISTNNLICAVVTLSSPSMIQEANMLLFARAIGLRLDNEMEAAPTSPVDQDMAKWIDQTFDEYLDGFLLEDYHIVDGRKAVKINDARVIAGLGNEFGLFELVRGFMSSGLSEGEAYRLILEAINSGILIVVENDDMRE